MTDNFSRSLLLSIKGKSWQIVGYLWAIGKISLSFCLWISFHDNITGNFQEQSLVISGAFYRENSKGNIVLHAFVSASIYQYKVKCSSLFVSLCCWMYLQFQYYFIKDKWYWFHQGWKVNACDSFSPRGLIKYAFHDSQTVICPSKIVK